jgi:limonene-1,2-epoxide hydrolase
VTPRELCTSYLASFATGDVERIVAHVSDDFANEHTAALGSGCVGIDEYRRRLPGFLGSMTALRYEVDHVEADGGRVWVAYVLRANVGDRTVAVPGATFFEVRGDRIARRVDYWDSLVFQRQLGHA